MSMQYGGILDGIMLAEQHNEADEKKAIDKAQYDKEWAFAREKFDFQVADAAEGNLFKYLSTIKPKGSSGSGSGGSGSVASNVKLTNTLKTIQGILPDGSNVAAQLANANLPDLENALGIIQAARKDAQKRGVVWTPQLSEDLFEELYVTTVVNNNAFDPTAFAESAGIDLEGNSSFGTPWKEILEQYTGPTSTTAVNIIENTPIGPFDLTDQAKLKSLYSQSLQDPLADMKAELDAKIAAGETPNPALVLKVDKALAGLRLTVPSTRLAIELVGPQVAMELLRRNPLAQNNVSLINKGLVFSEDPAGAELLAQAIRVGLLKEGDKITVGTRIVPLTAETVAAAQEN